MHTHLSLFEGDRNAFYESGAEYQLSKVGRSFIAGLLKHAAEITAVTNQWVNSYKRIWGGSAGRPPAYICWGHNNRSALVRVPMYKPGKAGSTRVEVRSIDSGANPYLAYAVHARRRPQGHRGGLRAPAGADDDVWALTDAERRALGIEPLPQNLGEAIDLMERSELVAETLGEHVFDFFLRNKRRSGRSTAAGHRVRAAQEPPGALGPHADRDPRGPAAAPARCPERPDRPPPALLGEWWEEVGVEVVVVRADAGEPVPTSLPTGSTGSSSPNPASSPRREGQLEGRSLSAAGGLHSAGGTWPRRSSSPAVADTSAGRSWRHCSAAVTGCACSSGGVGTEGAGRLRGGRRRSVRRRDVAHALEHSDTFLQLLGVSHPSPAKARNSWKSTCGRPARRSRRRPPRASTTSST